MNGFKNMMDFLSNIKKNNSREWFNDHKRDFEQNRNFFVEFIGQLIAEIEQFDRQIIGVDPKKSMYRIYRDVRFSKDKTPYKTHFGAYICKRGRSSGNPGYYIHIEPDEKSIIGGGLYHPMPDVLAKIRQEIDYNGDKLMDILESKPFKNRMSIYNEDKLKRKPKGYEDNNPHIEWLKMKSFIVLENFSDKDVLSKGYKDKVTSGFKEMLPFVTFLNEGIS
jgi:uncharacterized protein (TIGR02453 family)